jgi:hypothetical protein
MTADQAADFWRDGAHHLGSMCAQSLHGGDLQTAQRYAALHDKALNRAIIAAARAAGLALERPSGIDWFGDGLE